MDLDLLIDIIQQYPHIYDKSLPEFKDNQIRENSFLAIAKTLQVSVDEVIRAWKALRDRYGREKKKVPPSGSSAAAVVEWPYINKMSFLAKHIKSRQTYTATQQCPTTMPSNILNERDENMSQYGIETSVPSPAAGNIDDNIMDEVTELISTPSTSQIENTPAKRIKRGKDDDVSSILNMAKEINEEVKHARIRNCNASFGEYVARRLDEMPSRATRALRQEIVQLLESIE